MKRVICALLLCGVMFGATGCSGTFLLTKKLNSWHRGFDSKWADEAVFLACNIIPVYWVAMMGDAFIFNTVEFWGEKNPLASTTVDDGDESVALNKRADGSVIVNGEEQTVVLHRTDSGVVATDADGVVQYSATMDNSGKVSVCDSDGNVVRTAQK